MRIEINPDKEFVAEMRQALAENDGYCPCMIEKTPETKCMCHDFIENVESGPCHCGLYHKVE